MLWQRDLPDLLISEDARLVGLRLADGVMAVNRDRPNGFTSENWLSALAANGIVKPQNGDFPESSKPPGKLQDGPFICHEAYCIAGHSSGAVVIHTTDQAVARSLCRTATLIVIDDATARNVCKSGLAIVITKRDLARRGSASVSFDDRDGLPIVDVVSSITEPWRPWHEHRAYYRAARGLPPFQRKKRDQEKQMTTVSLKASRGQVSNGGSILQAAPEP